MGWPRRLIWIGIAISLAGVVALVWIQLQGPYGSFGDTSVRWELAMGPLDVVGIGLLVSIAAQIMETLQPAEHQRSE